MYMPRESSWATYTAHKRSQSWAAEPQSIILKLTAVARWEPMFACEVYICVRSKPLRGNPWLQTLSIPCILTLQCPRTHWHLLNTLLSHEAKKHVGLWHDDLSKHQARKYAKLMRPNSLETARVYWILEWSTKIYTHTHHTFVPADWICYWEVIQAIAYRITIWEFVILGTSISLY